MKWIIQTNLYNEAGYRRFIKTLEQGNIEYQIVKPVPFTSKFLPADFDSMTPDYENTEEPFVDTTGKVIAMGGTTLTRIAKERGRNPGTYHNDNFHYSKWVEGFGIENILNDDAVISKVKDSTYIENAEYMFVRPTEDTKSIPGTIMDVNQFCNWRLSVCELIDDELSPITKNTEIFIASVKKIYSEYRFFIVNGRIVTYSIYKIGDVVTSEGPTPDTIIEYVNTMVATWRPAKAFVIDIAYTPRGPKVIEINNINSSGFYAANTAAIVLALEDMENAS